MSTEAAPALEFAGVSHRYGGVTALSDIDLSVAPGEVLCLVGPSGCGKTTLLRIAAGLEIVQAGRVSIDGRVVAEGASNVPPEQRGVGMAFQDFALFPHLSVADNVAFGLHGLAQPARRARAVEALAQFGIEALAEQYPHMLSGGEQQRVALARALAPKPHLMLLDEPFSGLDSRLRDRIRDETLHVLKASGAATLLVTHDPEEAMFMADRIALMRAGRIEQIGRPVAIYFHPVNAFAAAFFSDVNRLSGRVSEGRVRTPFGCLDAGGLADGAAVDILIRPEALHLAWAPDGGHDRRNARITAARLLGRSTLLHLDMAGIDGKALHLHSRVPKHVAFAEGEEVAVTLDVSQAFVFPRNSTK
jgi:iron(III) transport system ATP-binding protein